MRLVLPSCQQADSADIFIVLIGYLLMHATFARLYLNMRRMGSNFWLPGMVLVSSTFAFLAALLAASLVKVEVDPICLSEALPFLVVVVGFDKPFALAKAVFTSPEIAPVVLRRKPVIEPGSSDELASKPVDKLNVSWAPPVPAREIVVNAVERVGSSIVKDFVLEIVVLLVGAASGVGGLKEFCKLAALILVADCCFLFSFYVAILTIMVEVSARSTCAHRGSLLTAFPDPPHQAHPRAASNHTSHIDQFWTIHADHV